MFSSLARKIFGTANERYLNTLQDNVAAINALEPELAKLTDAQLRDRTFQFRQQLPNIASLDELLIPAFATVREAAKRVLGQRHYDVQLMGGMVLHAGKIAEMKTGEGKTLVATLPVYLNALPRKGVHLVTVNDYLAKRDADWMGQVYRFLGLTVGCLTENISDAERKVAYACDVTYGTNAQFGFDYLRDNIAPRYTREDLVQREFNYAIVDEVDSILIDEARTPLIISGPAEDSTDMYRAVNRLLPKLSNTDYEKDEKARAVTLTDKGSEHIEQLLRESGLLKEGSLYDVNNTMLVHHVNQALKAHIIFKRDVDYIVKDGRVIIIDEFTGRMMEGRRFSEGLHQALEAKENVEVQTENQTLASVTLQNYFRMYPKLAGMTGTALTEAQEFGEIYNLDVIAIPTNREMVRIDHEDEVYRTKAEKYAAVLKLIQEAHSRKQPILVGTASIEKSEELSGILKKKGIKHEVLNARHHEREAAIIAQAGKPGAVTIATNMAGRGTDIQLGGNLSMMIKEEEAKQIGPLSESRIATLKEEIAKAKEAALAAGGLFIIGTERHESRRIDNQLRGRSGRQGDPGASKFFLSLEDDLMRIFGSERIQGLLGKMGLRDGEAITHPWITRALEKAQQKVEARNFDIRKHLLREDDVMNDQRRVIYQQRREIMESDDVSGMLAEMRQEVIGDMLRRFMPRGSIPEQWDIHALEEEGKRLFASDFPFANWAKEEGVDEEVVQERITKIVEEKMAAKLARYGAGLWHGVEKWQLLRIVDHSWKDHLLALDYLKQGTRLSAYAQRDPLIEYKREAFNLFENMLAALRELAVASLARAEINPATVEAWQQAESQSRQSSAITPPPNFAMPDKNAAARMQYSGPAKETPMNEPHQSREAGAAIDPLNPATWGRVQRNAPCPCGSGKKYKHCHGAG